MQRQEGCVPGPACSPICSAAAAPRSEAWREGSWSAPTRTAVAMFSSSSTCSAAGPSRLRASSSRPGSARSRAVFCLSSGCRRSSAVSGAACRAGGCCGAGGDAAAAASPPGCLASITRGHRLEGPSSLRYACVCVATRGCACRARCGAGGAQRLLVLRPLGAQLLPGREAHPGCCPIATLRMRPTLGTIALCLAARTP